MLAAYLSCKRRACKWLDASAAQAVQNGSAPASHTAEVKEEEL